MQGTGSGLIFPMLLSALLLVRLVAPADTTLLRVLTTNDFHGSLEPRVFGWSNGRSIGGAPALKATFDSAAARCRCAVLRLDAGDQMQGALASNLVYGRSVVEMMNAIGVDAAAIGNHELDWSVDTLKARMREAHYPWLGANVFDSVTGKRPDWARPYAMLERGGLKIGVIGYMPGHTKQIVGAAMAKGLVWKAGLDAFRDVLDQVRAQHPDLTILLAHEGAFCDTLPCAGEVIDLAKELDSTAVQLIVSGHTHSLVNTRVNGIPIVQARSNGTAYGVVDLIRRDDGSRTWNVRVETVYADQVTPDSGMTAMLARYRPMVEKLSTQKVAVFRDSLLRRGDQYALGNLIADAQRASATGIDFAIMNNGGIRRDIYPGPATYGDLFELQPFFNNVTRVWMTGAQVRQLLEQVVWKGKPNMHVSGLTFRYDPAKPAGQRVVSVKTAKGGSLAPARTYIVAMSDFLQNGGEGLAFLRTLANRRTGKTDLDALIAYLKSLPQPVPLPSAPRITAVAP